MARYRFKVILPAEPRESERPRSVANQSDLAHLLIPRATAVKSRI